MMARKNVLFEFGTLGIKADHEKTEYFEERNYEG